MGLPLIDGLVVETAPEGEKKRALVAGARRHARLERAWWIFAAVVAAQVTVPSIAFLLEPPTRFGFQMYSGVGSVPAVSFVTGEGQVTALETPKLIASQRAEIDWVHHLPAYVCDRYPRARTVVLTNTETKTKTSVACPG